VPAKAAALEIEAQAKHRPASNTMPVHECGAEARTRTAGNA
jgi:hypothetical protein